jgi:uncharacterized repeat protein (TIGR01451 family)
MEVGKMPAERKKNQSKGLTAAGLIAVTAATLLMMAWAIFPNPAVASHSDGVGGNPSCTDLGYQFGFKVDQGAANPVPNGTYDVSGFGSITILNADGTFFDWSSDFGIDAVIVKGGNASNVYEYDPESQGDSGLHAPDNASEGPAGLSHVEFCYDEDVTPDLDISKEVSDITVDEGGAFSYTITVENTGDAPATNVVVTDDLNDNLTGVSVSASQGTCDPVGLPGNTIECELGTIAAGGSETVTINATAPQLPLPGSGVCEISIANTASVDSSETDEVSDSAPPVTVKGTGCETTTTTTPPGGGGGVPPTTTPPPAPTTTPPSIAPTTVTPTTTTRSPSVAPTTVQPNGTAFTGPENVVPVGAIALMLMTSGSALLWAGSRRKRDQDQNEE